MGKGIKAFFSKRTDETLKKILGDDGSNLQQPEKDIVPSGYGKTVIIPVEQIAHNPLQPRKIFSEEKLNTLAESIKNRGVLQPVLVRRVSASPLKYELIAGERRLRAARVAGLSSIPVVVKETSDNEIRIVALVENLQREDLNVVEKTRAIGELFNLFKNVERVASELGLCLRIVERYMRIYKVIYSSQVLSSIFERQAEFIDFKTAETMASLFETILNSHESREKFLDVVNKEGIKRAIKYFMQLVNSTPRRIDKSFNIAVRKDELIFTARHDRNKGITVESKREIQRGLTLFFERLRESG